MAVYDEVAGWVEPWPHGPCSSFLPDGRSSRCVTCNWTENEHNRAPVPEPGDAPCGEMFERAFAPLDLANERLAIANSVLRKAKWLMAMSVLIVVLALVYVALH